MMNYKTRQIVGLWRAGWTVDNLAEKYTTTRYDIQCKIGNYLKDEQERRETVRASHLALREKYKARKDGQTKKI